MVRIRAYSRDNDNEITARATLPVAPMKPKEGRYLSNTRITCANDLMRRNCVLRLALNPP
jgi:hypothetical protein